MTTPDSIPPVQPPTRRTSWLALTASHRGAAHVANKLPNQDAVVAESAGADGVVAAVADGHGHWRHARSAAGSQFAVTVGCQTGQELAGLLDEDGAGGNEADSAELTFASQIGELVRETLVPAIVQRWREAVLADVAVHPFTAEEQDARQDGDDETVAYGSTLLLGVAVRHWLVLAQIGDGDIVGVRADGGALQPVPDDPQLDGRYTTSLCGTNARADFRIAVLDLTQIPLAAVMLATDGYGNAQMADQWTSAFSKDLAGMIRERDDHWLASQLPLWAAKCASSDGSADDTTVALLVGPPTLYKNVALNAGPSVPMTEHGSEDITVPVVLRSATIPAGHFAAGPDAGEPATVQLPAVDPSDREPGADGSSDAGPGSTALILAESELPAQATPNPAGTVDATGTESSSTGPGSTGPGSTGPGSTGPGSTGPGSTGPGNPGPGNTEPANLRPPDAGRGTTEPAARPATAEGPAIEQAPPEPATTHLDAPKIAHWQREQ